MNAKGAQVLVTLYGPMSGFDTASAQEIADYPYQEATFFGNLFASTPAAYVCAGGNAVRTCEFRACQKPDGSCDCGVVTALTSDSILRDCNTLCPTQRLAASNRGYRYDCPAGGRSWREAITTFTPYDPSKGNATYQACLLADGVSYSDSSFRNATEASAETTSEGSTSGSESLSSSYIRGSGCPVRTEKGTLSSGVPLSQLSGSGDSGYQYGDMVFASIDVPAGTGSLTARLTGGTGDADLFLRSFERPSTTTYDFYSDNDGNEERVDAPSPAAGRWYVLVYGYAAFSGVSLTLTLAPAATGTQTYSLGGDLSRSAGNGFSAYVDLPAGKSTLRVFTSGGTGDADLYLRKGSPPTTTTYDRRSWIYGNAENLQVDNPSSGRWYILVHAYESFSGVALSATY